MIISIIAAMGNNRVIGINNKLPWNLPADMEHFRQLTMGKPVIMGQKTFESIGKSLAGRKNIVLSRDNNFRPSDCIVAHSIQETLDATKDFEEVMIMGGVSIYSQFLPLADRMYLTLVEGDFVGDAYFPEFDHNDWIEVERIEHEADKNNPHRYSFVTLERKPRRRGLHPLLHPSLRLGCMKKNEKVLVVAREVIFENEHWQGLKTENLDYYLNLIKNNFQFRQRNEVENDSSWQQIIPYIVFNFQDKYFLYRYLKLAGEKRLKNDYLLGIGGHINPADKRLVKEDKSSFPPTECRLRDEGGKDILEVGLMREWNEEVLYKGNLLEKKLIGILNDEKRPVEAVHLGLVYLFIGDSPKIFVREKDVLEGKLIKLKDLGKKLKKTGGWAPIVYQEYLSKFLRGRR